MSQEIAEGSVDVKEYVSMLRSDLKDAGKKKKINGVVLFSVQEALKTMNITKITSETFKNEKLRKLTMQMIEG